MIQVFLVLYPQSARPLALASTRGGKCEGEARAGKGRPARGESEQSASAGAGDRGRGRNPGSRGGTKCGNRAVKSSRFLSRRVQAAAHCPLFLVVPSRYFFFSALPFVVFFVGKRGEKQDGRRETFGIGDVR